MQDNKSQTQFQARGCIQFGDLLIFGFGSFIMFAKTADLLGKFAPSDWFGFAPSDYGIASALLIEGFLVWRKVKSWLIPPKNFAEWATDIVTTLIPFALSIGAQVIDGYITTGLIASMSEQEKQTITTVVAALIGIPLLLDIVKTAIENAPEGIFDSIKTGDNGKSLLEGLSNFVDRILPRRENTRVSRSATLNKDVGQSNLKLSNNSNGKKANQEEPTPNP